MRASFAAVVAFAAVASASAFDKRQIPSCAMTCIASADTSACSSAADTACLCKSDPFVRSTYDCIAKDCKGDDLQTAIAAARELCRASGVTLTQEVPSSTGGSATATAPSTASATSPASATPTSNSNSAITSGASPMIGALAAMAGFVFAL